MLKCQYHKSVCCRCICFYYLDERKKKLNKMRYSILYNNSNNNNVIIIVFNINSIHVEKCSARNSASITLRITIKVFLSLDLDQRFAVFLFFVYFLCNTFE